MKRQGIALAGNILLDLVKNINCYPQAGMLANVLSISRAVGGCVPNTGIDLKMIDSTLPITAIGCVGDDENGKFVVGQLRHHNIDTERIVITHSAPTSFSDVMNLPTGERTFFHARGSNAEFGPEHVHIDSLDCVMLHIGYILLLDQFDAPDPEYGTVMARFLCDVQARGIKTSIDMVSDSSADHSGTIIPALKYCDYVIINEVECCGIWGYAPYTKEENLNVAIIREAMQRTLDCGVREKVIVHSKECGFCLSRDGTFTIVPSLMIPAAQIKGSVGAGDAFCAGSLYGIYKGMSDREILEFASAAAACNLFAENAVDGMRSREEILEVMRSYERRHMPDNGRK